MIELKVEIASHFFCVTSVNARAIPAIVDFSKKFIQWGLDRVPNPGRPASYQWAPLRAFRIRTEDKREYRFHIHTLAQFREVLKAHHLNEDMVEWSERPMFEPEQVVLTIQPGWTPRPHQPPVIEYLVKPPPPVQRLVELQTGQGKSFTAMSAMSLLGMRTVIIVRPMYIEKWLADMRRTFVLEESGDYGDIIVAQGSAQLMALLDLAKAGELKAKIVLISNKTIQNWIKLYEAIRDASLQQGWSCRPDELFQVLRAGVRLIDEVHQDFHLNFKIDLFTHVPRSMSLSATLINDDDYLESMYEIAYPKAERYKGDAYKKYIAAFAVMYRLKDPRRVRDREFGSKTYSHHAVEKSFMKDKSPRGMLENYMNMIQQVVKAGHFRADYKPGNRCLVFCAGIEMCTLVQRHLQKAFPNHKVVRYVEDDPFENLEAGDIVVSTLLSAGTAVDIAQLSTVVLTTAVSSSPSNLQGFGRLREMKDGSTPYFYYFVCEDIPKQVEYHTRKRELLQDRALSYKSIPMPGSV